MKMLYYFVVDLPSKFHDEIDFNGGKLYMDTKFDEFEHRVTQGEVVSIPHKFDTDVQPGDTLFFHHLVVINGGMPFAGHTNVKRPKTSIRYQGGPSYLRAQRRKKMILTPLSISSG